MAALAMSARGLSRAFRGFRAVDGVDLDIARGSVHALVGPNGAGKTTLFNLLTGYLRPTAGRIELDGRDITGLPPERIAGLGVARSFQITSLFPQLTALEQVELALQGCSGRGMAFWRSRRVMRRYREPATRVLEQVGLGDVAAVPGQELAYGRKRALELALALAMRPRVLLLDEPTAGMGLEDIDRTVELIEQVREDRTIVMVEHNMTVVGRLADRVTVLAAGRVLVEGGYDEVRADQRVIDAYLGAGHAAG